MVESMFDDVQDMSQLPVEAFSPLVYRSGDVVEGEIVSIDSEGLIVSIGLKSEGMVPQHQMRTLSDEERSNMALGDKIRDKSTSNDPANNTQSDRSDRALKARLIPPPTTIAAIPVAPSTRLQKPEDFTEEISMLL